MLLYEIDPLGNIVVTFLIGEIEDNEGCLAIPNIVGDQTPKSLLASSVPQLHPHHLAGEGYVFGDEIDTDGGMS